MAKKPTPRPARAVRPLTDEEKIARYLKTNKPTHCDPVAMNPYEVTALRTGRSGAHVLYDQSMPSDLRRLARIKIVVAFMTLQLRSAAGIWKTERDYAEAWLLGHGGDLEGWCQLAELPFGLVKRRAKQVVYERDLSMKIGYVPNAKRNTLTRTLTAIARRYELRDLVT